MDACEVSRASLLWKDLKQNLERSGEVGTFMAYLNTPAAGPNAVSDSFQTMLALRTLKNGSAQLEPGCRADLPVPIV